MLYMLYDCRQRAITSSLRHELMNEKRNAEEKETVSALLTPRRLEEYLAELLRLNLRVGGSSNRISTQFHYEKSHHFPFISGIDKEAQR